MPVAAYTLGCAYTLGLLADTVSSLFFQELRTSTLILSDMLVSKILYAYTLGWTWNDKVLKAPWRLVELPS